MSPQRVPEHVRVRSAVMVVTGTVIATIAFAIFVYPILAPPPSFSHRTSPLSAIKQQALATLMYNSDNDDRLPPAPVWMDAISLYLKHDAIFRDTSLLGLKEDEYGFALFEPVSTLSAEAISAPASVPLIFQSSDLVRNASGRLDTLRYSGDGEKRNSVAFMDAHSKQMPPEWPRVPVTIVLKESESDDD